MQEIIDRAKELLADRDRSAGTRLESRRLAL